MTIIYEVYEKHENNIFLILTTKDRTKAVNYLSMKWSEGANAWLKVKNEN